MNKPIRKYVAIFAVCIIVLCLSACNRTEHQAGQTEPVVATVVDIEDFGHVVLDLRTADFIAAGYELGDVIHVHFGSYEADMPFFDGYYTNPNEVMLRGRAPEKNIALCINYGDFSKETGIALGDTVQITMAEKAGMLTLQNLYALKYSDNRADYSSDAVFANFRAVTAGDIGDGKLYRSASPINNICGRASYANRFLADAEVATVLNLADSDEEILEYCGAEDFDSGYYLALYKDGKVKAVNLSSNFYSDGFAASVADGLAFLAHNEPPYAIHCTEGKDRAGFTAMVLEALMGAELEEIIDDYMLSFSNYYGVDKEAEPDRYEAVLNNNLMVMLCHVAGVETREQLEQVDWEDAAIQYLLRAGMTEEDIRTLQEKLRG